MWELRAVMIRPALHDFTALGNGPREVRQLVAGETILSNCLEWIGWGYQEPYLQLLICESCGTVGCEDGGFVSLRVSGPLVLFFPAWDAMAEPEGSAVYYAPPAWLKAVGSAYLPVRTFERVRESHRSLLPPPSRLAPLRAREAAALFQRDAPDKLFGEPPTGTISLPWRSLAIASSDGAYPATTLALVESLLGQYQASDAVVTLRPLAPDEQPIALWLDFGPVIEWPVLAYDGTTHRLLLADEYVIELLAGA